MGVMNDSDLNMDERVETVYFSRDSLVVDLIDGRTNSVPLVWYPKLLNATQKQRSHWEICGGGFGIHWPDIDEDLSTEGLLRGLRATSKKMALKTKLPRKRVPSCSKSRTKSRTKIKPGL